MKKKEKLNYMLQAVRNNEDCSIKVLKNFCFIHRVATDEVEFNALLQLLKEKGCVTIDTEKQIVIYRKQVVSQGMMCGVYYNNGTFMQVLYDPYRTNVMSIIS